MKLRRRTTLYSIPATFAVIAVFAHVLPAQSWDATAEFSSTKNPNGVWSYGWSLNRGAPINVFSQRGAHCGSLMAWSNQFPQYPTVGKNEAATTYCCSTVRMPAQRMFLHPGQAGENAVLRFTAPADGSYLVEAAFGGLDFSWPTNSDVSVVVQGQAVYSAELNGFDGPASCSATDVRFAKTYRGVFTLTTGQAIECKAGFGQNQRYNGDSTLVDCKITRVAVSKIVGTPCAGTTTLSSPAPVMGKAFSFSLVAAPKVAPGALLLSLGAATSLSIGPNCTIYLDLTATTFSFPFATSSFGQWATPFPLPNDKALHGTVFTTQALVLDAAAPLGLQLSNGLELTL
ncbi:MAG: hypothetical protein H6832_10355 [Planctomycetes bacterium]|nr:hypothetical protein [Planctomycetota bacterium]MCB9918791.1 hypothetical protein [Planctomycetota bacterium]